MTTVLIEGYANEEGLVVGSSDLNLKVRLRKKVIPKFEMDVGECAWRRKNTTLAIVANDREYDLPADFGKMLNAPLMVDAAGVKYSLDYIGEDDLAMSIAEQDTVAGTPSAFWFARITGPPTTQTAIRFDKLPDRAFTLYYPYLSEIQFADDTTSVEMSNYIPLKLQWGLVEALKVQIYQARLSINDPRLAEAKAEYADYVEQGIRYREPAMREAIKRIKTGPI